MQGSTFATYERCIYVVLQKTKATTASASQVKSSWRAPLHDFIVDDDDDDEDDHHEEDGSDDDSDFVFDTPLPVIHSAGTEDRENQSVDIKPGSAALLVSCSILLSYKICSVLVNNGSGE